MAALNSDGAAEWVLFVSNTELTTGSSNQHNNGTLQITGLSYGTINGVTGYTVKASYTGTIAGGKTYSIVIRNSDGAVITSTTGTTEAAWDATKDQLSWTLPYTANYATGTYTVELTMEGVSAEAVLGIQ